MLLNILQVYRTALLPHHHHRWSLIPNVNYAQVGNPWSRVSGVMMAGMLIVGVREGLDQ